MMAHEPKKKERLRVAIVVSHPIQHFVHLYKALAKREEIHLRVFFAAKIGVEPYFDWEMNTQIKWAVDLLGGYEHEFLPGSDYIKIVGFSDINNPGVGNALKRFSPDVVHLHGYAQLTMLKALLWCTLRRIPVMLSSDSSLLFQRPGWKQVLKKVGLPLLLRLFSGVLSTGDNNAAYYRFYWVKPDRIFFCPFSIDKHAFDYALANRTELRQEVRQRYGISLGETVLLFVGKLAPWKRPMDLLEALPLAQLKLVNPNMLVAFFAGDGQLREELETQAKIKGLRAVFAGFINVDVLPSIYAMADVLVFPSSREAYGLSAREATLLGLPLIVSDQIGCTGPNDAARPGVNALVYPAGNIEALVQSIVQLCSEPQCYESMAQASLSVARAMDETVSTNGYLKAVSTLAELRTALAEAELLKR